MISPILANIYLHYVLDLWFEVIVRKQCRGQAYLVRYCDDFICCFQYKDDAERFYVNLKERLGKFNLEIAEEKTQIIAFGRFAADNCRKQGKGKPDTFDFLGFTHYCSTSQNGRFRVKRKTSCKKLRQSLARCKAWLHANLTTPAIELMKVLELKLRGYYRYYGVTDNSTALGNFHDKVRRMLFKWFNRRSQRKTFTWEKYALFLKLCLLLRPRIYVSIYDVRPELLSYL